MHMGILIDTNIIKEILGNCNKKYVSELLLFPKPFVRYLYKFCINYKQSLRPANFG